MSDATGAGEAPDTYLIVLRHVLVAEDIAMTVAEFDPAARVIAVASPAEALPHLDGVGQVAMAFVGQGPSGFRDSDLHRALDRRGSRVVLLGEEAEAAGEAAGFPVLVRPFTTVDVLERLAGG